MIKHCNVTHHSILVILGESGFSIKYTSPSFHPNQMVCTLGEGANMGQHSPVQEAFFYLRLIGCFDEKR
jgi:hypothetical protein